MSLEWIAYDFPMSEKVVPVLPRRKRRKAIPHVFIVDANKPDDPYRALKEVDVSEGAEFKVEKGESGILLKPLMPDEAINRQELRDRLKEGAIEMAQRDIRMAQEWFPLEQEIWEKNQ